MFFEDKIKEDFRLFKIFTLIIDNSKTIKFLLP